MSNSASLRDAFTQNAFLRLAGAHNALGAKLVERAGFDRVWASGLEISTSYGLPDASILTMSEFLHLAQTMVEAVGVPVVADCDTGFGGTKNLSYMVKKYESAGVSAVCIEDQCFPKRNSLLNGGHQLVSVSEFVDKISAAKETQRRSAFMVIARIESFIAGYGVGEALDRAAAYVDAGADAILIHSKSRSINEVASFANLWRYDVPLIVVPTTFYAVTIDTLQRLGIRMVIYANHGIRAAIQATVEVLDEIVKTDQVQELSPELRPWRRSSSCRVRSVQGPETTLRNSAATISVASGPVPCRCWKNRSYGCEKCERGKSLLRCLSYSRRAALTGAHHGTK